jgi:WD40 repeat protein
LTFARFEVKTNSCTALLYASGGFPPVPVVQPTLRLTAPNGGEIFLAGADTVITWEGVLPTDTVRLQYSIDSGKTWRTITDTATGLRYAWKNIPNTPSEKCLMRVMSNGFEEKTITLRGHTKNVVSCSFNNDGSRLLTTGNFEAIIKIWDVISGKEIQSISPPSNFINTAVFSPTGNQIAISGDGYGVEIIDGLTLKRIAHKVLYSTKALFSPNGQYLLVVNDYIGVMLFNPNTLQEIRRIPAALPLNDAVFSHNGDLIVTAHNDGLVKIWDTKTGQEIRSLKSASQKTIFCAVMSSDGSRIIAAGDNSEIIDTQTGALICKIEANARSNVGNQACFSNDGTQVLIATNSGAYIVNAFTGKTIKHYQLANDMSVNPTLSVAYSPDMSKIAFSGAPIAKIITNNFAQTSTSANVWSIISPQLSTSTARTIDMGAALVSTSKDSVIQTFLTNASPYPVRVDSLRFGGAQAQEFSMVSGQPPFVIAAGASAAVEFRFRPSAVSLRTASLLVFTQSDTVRLSIQGTGVQQSLTQRTRVIDFGRVLLGTNKDTMLTGILRNTGGVPITLSAPRLGLPDTTQFSVRGFGAVGASAVAPTYTLQAGDSVAIALRFAPSRLGRTSGQVQFRYAVPGVSSAFAPLSVGLFGEGILQALTAQTLVDMGTVVVGSLRDSTVQAFITNPNARAISLDAVRFENTQNAAQALDFTCLAILPQTIPANAMIALSFRFRPSAAGLRTAQIVMGAETQTLRASIQGNGTELRSGSLQLPSIQARVGGLVQMPIFLRNRIGDIPVGTTVSANLMYFYGLLRPQPPTPLGTVSGTMRTIPLQLTVPSLDENIPLSTVTFRAAFAFPQATPLSLSNMTATPSMALTAQQGSFTLLDAPLPTFSLQPSNDAAFGNGGEQNTAVRILSISPNPAQTGFSVRFAAPEGESVSLSVHNALATPVLARNLAFGANEATISTNSWTPGVYTLRVQTASGLAVGRVVVVP